MLFKFRNIGKIAEADIEINGLTVLGGYNDTGKSTIGKTLYAIIKTLRNSEIEYNALKKEHIKDVISRLKILIRKKTRLHISYNFSQIKDMVSLDKQDVVKALSIFSETINDFQRVGSENADIIAEAYKQSVDKISEILEEEVDDCIKYKNIFDRIHRSLFRGEFVNKKNLEMPAEIICNDSEKDILTIIVEGNISKEFVLTEKIVFDDVTLIESPIILNQSDFIRATPPDSMSFNCSFNFDLIRKINYSELEIYNILSNPQEKLIRYINTTIDGKLYYDEKGKDYIFERDQDLKIKFVNMASGIKSFGIIQLLVISDAINPDTLLIIDEPEVHLHPEWQLKYAELITLLVDSGVYVLISSHSPYMIEALKVYSDKLKLDKITRFYIGNAHEKGTIFQDVTEDMEPLFHQLAFPMQKLTFEA